MSWTDPRAELSDTEKLVEQMKGLPPRDHIIVVSTMALMEAFHNAQNVESSHFKDLAAACGKAIKHISTADTLEFLIGQLKKAPAEATVSEIIDILAIMGLKTSECIDAAVRDMQKLVRLLPENEP